jgi:hypothetical protein
MSCAICLFKTKLGFKETIEPAASSSYITVNSALPIPKRNGPLSQGNLDGQYLGMFQALRCRTVYFLPSSANVFEINYLAKSSDLVCPGLPPIMSAVFSNDL